MSKLISSDDRNNKNYIGMRTIMAAYEPNHHRNVGLDGLPGSRGPSTTNIVSNIK